MAGSNGNRMAGEEMSKAERNRQIREEIGNDSDRLAKRISGVDREAFDFEGYSDKDINMAMQGGTFDHNDYARLTGSSGDDNNNNKPTPADPPSGGDPISPTPPGAPPQTDEPDPWVFPPGGGPGYGGEMSQQVQQDNDVNTNVTGDNNTVTNKQDNSVGQGFLGGYLKKHNFFK